LRLAQHSVLSSKVSGERSLHRRHRVIAALIVAMAGWPAQAQTNGDVWPTATSGKIISTPNWSDYRVYPPAARRRGQEGRVFAEVLVGVDGVPTKCRMRQSSGSPELDAGTCSLMLSMRFEPATDSKGVPVQSVWARRINWLLDDPRPFASSMVDAELQAGQPCRVVRAEGAYATWWSSVACTFFADRKYLLGTNAATNKVATVSARLDANDGRSFAVRPWPNGTMIAREIVSFEIDQKGDAIKCRASVSTGFGPRGLNDLSPCGRLVSSLWLKKAEGKRGSIETRVYLAADDGRST